MLSGRNSRIISLSTPLLFRVLATVGLIMVMIVPGAKPAPFNGLPLSSGEFGFVVFFLGVVWTVPWVSSNKTGIGLLGALLFVAMLQGLVGTWLPAGWSVCLRRAVASTSLETPCERSAEFRLGEASFILPRLELERKNSPLYFMNTSNGLNFWGASPDEPKRTHLPYSFEAVTQTYARTDTSLFVDTTIPGVTVQINDELHTINPGNPTRLRLPSKVHSTLKIFYTTERKDSDQLSVKVGGRVWYRPVSEPWAGWLLSLVILMVWGTLGGITVILLKEMGERWKMLTATSRRALIVALVGLVLFSYVCLQTRYALPDQSYYLGYTIGLFVLIWGYLFLPEEDHALLLPFFMLMLFIGTAVFVTRYLGPSELVIFPGGEDELGHVSYAREVMAPLSRQHFLEAAEPSLFYYQPLYRYVAGALYKIVGEAMWGVYVIQTLLGALVLFLTARLTWARRNIAGSILFTLVVLYFFSRPSSSLFLLTQSAYQQSLGSPLFLISVLLLVGAYYNKESRWWVQFSFGLLWGIALMIRTDLTPALGGVVLYLLYLVLTLPTPKLKLMNGVAMVLGLSLFPLLVAWRNVIVGGSFVVFPTSTLVNILPEFYTIFPYTGLPSNVTGGEVILTIIGRYAGHYQDLGIILWHNVAQGLIGSKLSREFLWGAVPVVLALDLVRIRRISSHILVTLWLAAVLVALVVFNAFFRLHNGIVMIVHLDYLAMLVIVFGIGWRAPSLTQSFRKRR